MFYKNSGYRRVVAEPGCLPVEVQFNVCRGYCQSYTLPSLVRHAKHKIISKSSCCRIKRIEEDVIEILLSRINKVFDIICFLAIVNSSMSRWDPYKTYQICFGMWLLWLQPIITFFCTILFLCETGYDRWIHVWYMSDTCAIRWIHVWYTCGSSTHMIWYTYDIHVRGQRWVFYMHTGGPRGRWGHTVQGVESPHVGKSPLPTYLNNVDIWNNQCVYMEKIVVKRMTVWVCSCNIAQCSYIAQMEKNPYCT